MKKITVFLMIMLFLCAGCSSVHVRTDYDRDADFSAYHTYSWLPHSEKGHKLMRNKMVRREVVAAVNREMKESGFREVSRQEADLLITYYIGARNRVDVTRYGYRYGRWGRIHPRRMSVHSYKEGTLIVDLVDTETRELVWRGWASSVLHGREGISRDINNSVRELFKRYPPGR